jgi:Na+-translocating ferredoxin:NAD+ oxidoreductase RnfG subunit
MKKQLIAASLFLSASAPAFAETEIDRLLNVSQQISAQVQNAKYAVTGAVHAAVHGDGVAGVGTVTDYRISTEQMNTYNEALDDVRSAVYYNAEMFLEDAAEEAMDNLAAAVDVFAVAAQEIAKVDAVAEVAENVDTVEEQVQLQEFVQNEDVELTQQDIVAYNDSLENVEAASQEAAAFLIASKAEYVTAESDYFTDSYNQNLLNATASYTATNDTLELVWANGAGISYSGFFADGFMSIQEVLGVGQSIYEGNTYE